MRDRLSVALTTFVGSHAKATLSAAAENCPDTARKGRVTVTLTMSALAHSFVDGTTASMRMMIMGGNLWTVAGKALCSSKVNEITHYTHCCDVVLHQLHILDRVCRKH